MICACHPYLGNGRAADNGFVKSLFINSLCDDGGVLDEPDCPFLTIRNPKIGQ